MNGNWPDARGEYELTSVLRSKHSFCASHQIVSVECRSSEGHVLSSGDPLVCSKEGYRCRSHKKHVCVDHEVRFLCQCRCQDGLGVQSGSIEDDQLRASSYKDKFSQAKYGRLRGERAWSPTIFFDDAPQQWFMVDLLKIQEVSGVEMQGHPLRQEWVTTFTVQYSNDDVWWATIMMPDSLDPMVFSGNEDNDSVKRIMFQESFYARYVRLIPLEYHQWIALRLELVGCDIIESTTAPVVITTSEPEALITTVAPKVPTPCKKPGWTSWMNSHIPGTGDWDDRETFQSLRMYHHFCEDSYITQIRCRVAGTDIPSKKAGQRAIECNLNKGLFCDNELQEPNTCLDYEVQLFCSCPEEVQVPTTPVAATTASTTTETTSTEAATTTVAPTTMIPIPDRCDPARPHLPHPTDCYLFYHCVERTDSVEMVEKTCNPPTMFNPVTMICDWPESVIKISPHCATTTTRAPKTTRAKVTTTVATKAPLVSTQEVVEVLTTTAGPEPGDLFSGRLFFLVIL